MKFLSFFINKYLLATAFFLVWIIFFDQHDVVSRRQQQRQLNEVRNNISFLNDEIDKMEQEYKAMLNDPGTLERFAREQFRMKKDNEDLYIIENSE